ncbi:hypothetical protein A4G20_01465 [Pasteurellaceae bacterium RH1A]|nr:hypothetical protein A4G20_01465 [Pasteurellaceae bacterium RH1A]
MSIYERIFHAVLFELLALILSVIGLVLFTDHSASDSALMTLSIATIAMLWNFVFNWAFDKIFTGKREERGFWFRIFHTITFEAGLLIFTLPLVAYIMQVSWLEAFIMDIALTMFILVYAMVFNWIYDHVRLRFVGQ